MIMTTIITIIIMVVVVVRTFYLSKLGNLILRLRKVGARLGQGLGQGPGKVGARLGQGWGKVRTKSKVRARSGQEG